MAVIDDIQAPVKQAFYLVEFSWNVLSTPSYARYTNWNGRDLTVGASVFASTPSLAVQPGDMSGSLQDQEWKIVLPLAVGGFSDAASGPDPWPPIVVKVWEFTLPPTTDPNLIDPSTQAILAFKGQVTRTVRNYQGRSGSVMLGCVTVKSLMRVPLGIPANDQCVWTFLGFGCNYGATGGSALAAAAGSNVTVTAINGKLLTATGATVPAPCTGGNGKYFHRGYLKYRDLQISIRDWTPGAPTLFYLTQQAPASWVGLTVSALPGCDKSIDTCRARYANEAFFGGFGHGIPNYNPILEAHP